MTHFDTLISRYSVNYLAYYGRNLIEGDMNFHPPHETKLLPNNTDMLRVKFVFQIFSFCVFTILTGCSSGGSGIVDSKLKINMERISNAEIHEGDTFVLKVSRNSETGSTNSTDSSSDKNTTSPSKPEIRLQATYGGDFAPSDLPQAPTEFVIPENQDEAQISFLIPPDGLYDSRTKLLKITTTDGSLLETEIINTDAFPQISLSSVQATEGQTAVLTITLDHGSKVPLVFDYEFQFGTASGNDIENSDSSVIIAAGEVSKNINIVLKSDSFCETNETFSILVKPPLGLGSTQSSGIAENFTIIDSTLPTYSISSVTNTEGSSSSVTLSSNMSCPFDRTVSVSTQDQTAASGSDYTAITNQNFVIASGTTQVLVPVSTLNDSLNENDETFLVSIVAATKGIVSGSGTVTITDNDPLPTLSFTSSTSTYAENAGTVQVNYSLNQASGRNITATLSLSGTATAGSDYANLGNSITIPAGTTSGSISVSITDDSRYESSENMILTLSQLSGANAGAALIHTLTITDNDSPPAVSISSGPTINEGTSAAFTVTLSNASDFSTTVNYATSDGTGVAGSHYTTTSGTLTFAVGETSKTISVSTLDNSTPCQTDRTFSVTISSPTNATLGSGTSSTATIKDNDNPTLTIADVSATEGNTATLTAYLQMACAKAASFSWTTQNNTAISGTDYTAASGSVNFAIGETSKTIQVSTINDVIDQGSRNFKINFSNPTNIDLPVSPTTITINDNDSAPTISWATASQTVTESQGSLLVTVSLSHITNRVVTASIAPSGTAVNNVDYTLPSTTLNIPAGQSSAQVTVNILRDNDADDGKILKLTLSSITGEPLGATTEYDLTILDDPYQGPIMTATSDSSKITYLSGINSSLVLAAGVPNSNTGGLLSQNSSGSPKVQDFSWSGDSNKVVFIGNFERASSFDLFSVNPNGTSRTRLNPSGWPNTRQVLKAQSVSGTTRVIYQFDQTTSGLYDIASVNTDGSSPVSIASGLNTGTESVKDFAVSLDGSRVVYIADTATAGRFEIFSVTPTGASTQKLNLTLSAGQSVDRLKISPDSTKVAFVVMTGSGPTRTESLFISPVSGGSSSLLSLSVSSRQIGDFQFSPDSSKIAFTHNATTSTLFDLYAVNSNGSSRFKINPTYTVGSGISLFKFTSDSSKIGFLTDATTANEFDLYIGSASGSSCCTKLNDSLVVGGKIESFDFTANSSSVVYLGRQDSNTIRELYSVSTSGSSRVKLNLTPVMNGNISKFIIVPNGSRVIYLGDQDSQGQSEAYSVNLNGTSRVKLNPSLSAARKADDIYVLPNSSKALYRMNNEDITKYEWYSISPAGGTSTKLFSPD